MQTRVAVVSLVAAVLAAAPRLALAQGAAFCLKTTSGVVSCSYHTMILCEQAKQPNSRDQCIPRFEMDGTTGSSARQPAAARHSARGRSSIARAVMNCGIESLRSLMHIS